VRPLRLTFAGRKPLERLALLEGVKLMRSPELYPVLDGTLAPLGHPRLDQLTLELGKVATISPAIVPMSISAGVLPLLSF